MQKKVIEATDSQIHTDIMKKEWIVFSLFIIMLAGLLWSRAILSISMGFWLLFSVWQFKTWIDRWQKDSLILWGVAPVLIGILGCWQNGFTNVDLSFLLTLSAYPIVSIAVKSISALKQPVTNKWFPASADGSLTWLMTPWIHTAVIAVIYPLTWYILHMNQANTAYGAGQSLPTFMDNDHVRFGMFLCSASLFVWLNRKQNKRLNHILLGLLVFAVVLLAVRTAWVMLLLMAVIIVSSTFIVNKKYQWKKLLIVAFVLFSICVAGYFLFPTVQQKIAYTIYDWQQYQPGDYDATLSDGTRRAINFSAWEAIKAGQSNIGWSAIPESLSYYFTQNHIGQSTNFGWPFNQWLFWWMGAGWWGMLLFSIWLFYPAYKGFKEKNIGLICWSLAIAVSCMVETNLGYQYGVWLHAWGIGLLWKTNLKI